MIWSRLPGPLRFVLICLWAALWTKLIVVAIDSEHWLWRGIAVLFLFLAILADGAQRGLLPAMVARREQLERDLRARAADLEKRVSDLQERLPTRGSA